MGIPATSVITVSVKLEPDIKERLHQLGKNKHRSTHWLMKEAIRTYLAQEESALQLERETLARWEEVQNGKIVSHKAVMQWLDTWGTDDETGRPPCGS